MRIDGSFNFPQFPQRLPQQQSVSPTPEKLQQPESPAKAPEVGTQLVDFAAEFARTHQASGSESFYSTDRNLSLKGQAAMDAYVTTAGFQSVGSRSEWIGVDIYA